MTRIGDVSRRFVETSARWFVRRLIRPGLTIMWMFRSGRVLLLGLAFASGLSGHPISISSVIINVVDEKIEVDIQIMPEDLIFYYSIEAGPDFRFPTEKVKEKGRLHREFLLRYFQLRDRDGHRLEGDVIDIDFSDIGDEGVPMDGLMAHMIVYRLEYPLEERLEFLTVGQNFGGDYPVIPAEMEVRFFHKGVRIATTAILSHRTAHTVRLDWNLDWDAAQSDIQAVMRQLRERREDELGITSYSAVYSYMYITDTEVRHEILIPLLTLDTWLPMPRAEERVMTVAEQRAVRDDVLEFLKDHNRVEINGARTTPVLQRLDFFGPDFRDFARRAPEQDVSVYNARVGVVLSFPSPDIPRNLRFEWDYYDERLPFLRPRVYVFEDESIDALLDYYQTAFEWEADRERAGVVLASVARPEPPPKLRVPVWSLLAGFAALALAGIGLKSGPGRRRVALAAVAVASALGAFAVHPYGVEVPHPLKSPPEIDDDEAAAVFEALHGNIYEAFGYRDRERIYDGLAGSVAGPLLEDLYLQILSSLRVEEEGGAVSRVSGVELVDGTRHPVAGAAGRQAFEYRCVWTVTGTVEHWGHIHTRTNQYEGIFVVEGLSSGWKITGFEPLREERLQFVVGLRR